MNNKHLAPKVLQFGEGNFLRAFVDWMIQKSNDALDLNMGVVVVQPLPTGMVAQLKAQDCKYNVILEGVKDGQPIREIQPVECLVDAINPYTQYQEYKEYFLHPDLEFIISNTTEAGISRLAGVDITAQPPISYPAKMVALLYERFQHFGGDKNKGLSIICCELIENNGTVLKEIVFELAQENKLPQAFITWMQEACSFCNSLVDRIVTGFPKDTIKDIQAELQVEDNMVVVGEYYHLWAIEGDARTKAKFPLHDAGLNVLWLDELKAFRDKKVRVLNGAHTALVPVGLLAGHATVKEAFADADIADYIHSLVAQEVLPNIDGDTQELTAFADEILERFLNPYIKHYLKDISLNSLSKWVTRDWPSLHDSAVRTGQMPVRLSFSLAALLMLYTQGDTVGFTPNDTPEHLEAVLAVWHSDAPLIDRITEILSNTDVWGHEIPAMTALPQAVATHVQSIQNLGIREALRLL